MFIDTHAHLTMPEYSDLSEVLQRALAEKVEAFICPGFDLESSKQAVNLARDFFNIYACVGVHPHDAGDASTSLSVQDTLKTLAKQKKVVAIGEAGLDYFRNLSPKEVQIGLFRFQIRLAQELNLPLVVHSREADEDTMRILSEEDDGNLRVVLHCFAGSKLFLDWAIARNFMISFAGMITFPKAHNLREIVRVTPLSHILLETDCPYLSPQEKRGQRNEPAFLKYIAQEIAHVKGTSQEEVGVYTTQNARKFFGLEK